MSDITAARELDAQVAEKVLGWERTQEPYPGSNMGAWFRPTKEYQEYEGKEILGCTAPSMERPENDYFVLMHVRENWLSPNLNLFPEAFTRLWAERAVADGELDHIDDEGCVGSWLAIYYRPGDYARAALAVVGEQDAQ